MTPKEGASILICAGGATLPEYLEEPLARFRHEHDRFQGNPDSAADVQEAAVERFCITHSDVDSAMYGVRKAAA